MYVDFISSSFIFQSLVQSAIRSLASCNFSLTFSNCGRLHIYNGLNIGPLLLFSLTQKTVNSKQSVENIRF